LKHEEREGEGIEKKWEVRERHYMGRGQEIISLVLKVPRQCLLVLLLEAYDRN
jgi:hypothetical protein